MKVNSTPINGLQAKAKDHRTGIAELATGSFS